MYWIYLALFTLAVLTPELVNGPYRSFPEDRVEAGIVFFFGATGFLIYFAKEKAILRHIAEKLRLQKEKQDMTKDLSDSYSYIGEVNRKMDLMMSLVLDLPEAARLFQNGEKRNVYESLGKAILLFSKGDSFTLRIVDTVEKKIEKEISEGAGNGCGALDIETLLGTEQVFREEGGCVVATSPKSIGPYRAYLLFPKSVNRHEDRDMFAAFATEGLLLFFLEKENFLSQGKSSISLPPQNT